MKVDNALSIEDLRHAARRRLPAGIFGYVDGGAEDLESLKDNRRAFGRWAIRPRALVDVSSRNMRKELFGRHYEMPVGICPMGVAGLCRYDADASLARAAREAHIPFILSAGSITPLERIAAENPGMWYQAYIPADMKVVEPLLARVAAAGVEVLVITIDVPVASFREHELRNGFSIPVKLSPRIVMSGLARPRWLTQTFLQTLWRRGIPHFENFTAQRGGPIIVTQQGNHRAGRDAMTWREISAIRAMWPGKLVIKGILRGDDALTALDAGADGIVVSNHGGRQLDGAVSSLDALAEIAATVGSRKLSLLLDSGVRRGTDVLKALALGADFVFIGRAAMYGLAAYGQPGVARALGLLRQEISTNMALMGCADLSDLSPDDLCNVPGWRH